MIFSKLCCRIMAILSVLVILPLMTQARRHLVIGAVDSIPPMEYLNADGVPSGFYIDIMTTVAERLGYDYSVKMCNVEELKERFVSGEIDILPSPQVLLFDTLQVSESNMILLSYVSVVSRSDDNFTNMDELKDKRVVICRGTLAERYLESNSGGSPAMMYYTSSPERAMRDVAAGRVDAFVSRESVAHFIIDYTGLDGLVVHPLNVPPMEQRVATRDENLSVAITGELSHMRRDGVYDKIYNKWFAEPNFYERYFVISLVTAVVLSLIFVYVIVLLVRKIYNAHKLLQLERHRMAILMDAGQFEGSEIDLKSMTLSTLSPMGEVVSVHTVDEALDSVYTKDRPIVVQNIENAREGNGGYGEFVARLAMPDGNYRYNMIYTRELCVDGRAKLYWVKKDVNESYINSIELARYHARMDMALKNTGILQWDYDVVRKQVTVRNARIVPDGTVMGLADCLDKLPTFKPVFDIMDEGQVPEFSRDVTYVSPTTGETHYSTMMVRAMARDDDGRVLMYTGIRKDNTELIKIQKDLERAKEKAEAADKLKSQFLDNMSHEIRTPLNAIVGFSSLLQDATDDERQQYVEIINRGSEQLLSLINDILEMSSIEAGTLDLCEEPFDLSEDFNAMAEAMQKKITEPGVELIVDNPYKSCIVTLDERRVNQIVRIFMTNAIKNTHKGHVKMSYNYVEGTGVTISVEDTGVGIDEENFGHVFRRFEKIDNFVQGSGLELAIVKAIADHTGNEVGFTSKKGVGSTFYFIAHCEAKVTV